MTARPIRICAACKASESDGNDHRTDHELVHPFLEILSSFSISGNILSKKVGDLKAMKNKKYEVLVAIQKAAVKKNRSLVNIDEIKEFYKGVDWTYLIYLCGENSITQGDKSYGLLPKGEDYISSYEASKHSRKINLIAMWAAIGAFAVGLVSLLQPLLKWSI